MAFGEAKGQKGLFYSRKRMKRYNIASPWSTIDHFHNLSKFKYSFLCIIIGPISMSEFEKRFQ